MWERAYDLPSINPAQAREMAPTIQAYLESNSGLSPDKANPMHLRSVCTDVIVDILPTSDQRLHVGLTVNCGDYARFRDTLAEGSGYWAIPTLLTMSDVGGRYRVLSMEQYPYDDGAHPEWLYHRFPRAVVHEITGTAPLTAGDPAIRARALLGLPAKARIEDPYSGAPI
jgi:hypothetical protein